MTNSSAQVKNKKLKEKGFLTLDFIFSILAIYAISMVFALLAVSLMFSTISQYVAFSVSRAHISGQLSREQQELAAVIQFENLMSKPGLGTLLKISDQGWFKAELISPGGEIIPDFAGDTDGGKRQKGYGVHIRYTSNILKNFKLPLIGSPSDGGDDKFGTANIYSFLYREPTTNECLEFNKTRWKTLKERFPQIGSMPGDIDNKAYGDNADNGC